MSNADVFSSSGLRGGWRVLVGGVVARVGGGSPHPNLPPKKGEGIRGDARTGEGGHKGSPLRRAATRDRPYGFMWQGDARTIRAGRRPCDSCRTASVGGRAATRDRPYGGWPQGIAPTEGGHKGSPLRVHVARGRPYDSCRTASMRFVPDGVRAGEGGHKGSPLRRAATRDRPYGGRPQGIAPTGSRGKGTPVRFVPDGVHAIRAGRRPCGSRRGRTWRGLLECGGVVAYPFEDDGV